MTLSQLYQDMILEHNRSPRNLGRLDHASHKGEGYNPICGDHYWVELLISDNKITDIKFHGQGCAISKASASMMTESLKGLSIPEAQQQINDFIAMLTKKDGAILSGKLQVFSGVKAFPMRVKCATLAWHSSQQAIASSPLVKRLRLR